MSVIRWGRRARGGGSGAAAGPGAAGDALRILVYSSSRLTRSAVVSALGPRPVPGLPAAEYVETATAPMALRRLDAGGIALAILDGEAAPAGGLGLARQLKDEISPCPPALVLLGRRADAWLAEWSRAEAAVLHPLDPFDLAEAAARLLRRTAGAADA